VFVHPPTAGVSDRGPWDRVALELNRWEPIYRPVSSVSGSSYSRQTARGAVSGQPYRNCFRLTHKYPGVIDENGRHSAAGGVGAGMHRSQWGKHSTPRVTLSLGGMRVLYRQ